jgi:DNA-binding transcriptional LysR family regulator
VTEDPGRLTLRGIEVFLAVVEEGSISGAAKRLEASASSVSQQITNLETALDARLVDRAARPLSLTPAGALFLRRAQAIQGEALRARAELAEKDFSRLQRLSLGMIEDFDADVTPRLLSDMGDELKACHFVLETGASYRLAEMLEARLLDVIVAADLDLSAEWMEVHPLLADPFIVAAPPGAVDPGEDVLAQLLRLPLIRYSGRQMMGRQIEAHLHRLGLAVPQRFEMDSYHAIMAMVAAGAGWTITTPLGFMRAQRFRGGVAVMPLPFEAFQRRISLVARRGVMERMPAEIAARLKPLLTSMVVKPGLRDMPWLDGALKVL